MSLAFVFFTGYSNDGAFRSAGNQLIPMYETDISVKKEILTINRIGGRKVAITVYYEFFNPKADKMVEVGFEATSPSGDVNARPVNGHQPFISQFTVNMNDSTVPYKVSIVSDSMYYKNGIYKSKTVAQALKEADNADYVDFFYVYHFKAKFKQGLNIIKHTYTAELSTAVYEDYSYTYILSAAGRWANKQIDDFTLQINMGEYQDLRINNTFFSTLTNWQLPEGTKSIFIKKDKRDKEDKDKTEFYIRKGGLVFQQVNFKPTGELFFVAPGYQWGMGLTQQEIDDNHFSAKRGDPLPFSVEYPDGIHSPADDLSKRILKNLPYARRGYIFKAPELQGYFERQPWYLKDVNYHPDMSALTVKEQEWLKKL
ncbi:hypothetical protein A4D02_34465 [Niastella koreensis]|uniref:YARHG domain-containing protein n=1 Tax=Niastella koreensis TaxID=354356 RepID=A0ABX3NTC8_9BACT|nr:hypothetical protein A4D02_34465 [Niastella koreensis]